MDSQKPNNFEEEWQKAFNDASFSPPSDMWERIEQDLERKKRRPFLFFLRPSAMLAGIAAMLILALGGILFLNKKDTQTLVANNTQIQPNKNSQNQSNESITSAENDNITVETPNDIETVTSLNESNNKQNILAEVGINQSFAKPKKSNKNIQLPTLVAASLSSFNTDNAITATRVNNNQLLEDLNIQMVDSQRNRNVFSNIIEDGKSNNLALLQHREYQYFGSRYTLKREKLNFEVEENETPILASNDSKFWVGIQSGVSPFDPNMKLGGLNTVAMAQADAFAKVSNTPSFGASPSADDPQPNVMVSQPQNAIMSGIGINTGVAMGYKISKKWNFESGIRYLRGNSTLNSNTYAFQQNGYVNTFFADYLLQNSSSQEFQIANSPINTVVADASQFGNRYEYLMIPLQVGYEIGLSKKVALNLLAGVSTDIFLQNTIINDNSIVQEKSTINNSSNIYKPLNLSGLGGVRASYLISKHWQLNLGSSYQHSLFSGINNSTALQMRLKMFGLNYGLNYRF